MELSGTTVGVVLKSFGDTQQVYVDDLDEDSSLLKDSVSVGDVLYSVNGTKVHNATEAADLIAKQTTLLLLFVPRAPPPRKSQREGYNFLGAILGPRGALETVQL